MEGPVGSGFDGHFTGKKGLSRTACTQTKIRVLDLMNIRQE
jgi:hypothetical protein